MKRVILIAVGLCFMSALSYGMNYSVSSDTTVQVSIFNSAGFVYRITVTNSQATPNTVAFYDSTTLKGYVVIPASSPKQFLLEARITTALIVQAGSNNITTGIEYVPGTAYGRYWYSVSDTTTINTPYASYLDVMRVIVANNNDTGQYTTLKNGATPMMKLEAKAYDTEIFNFEAVRFTTSLNVLNNASNSSVMIFRRE